jgi:hypothetical protein
VAFAFRGLHVIVVALIANAVATFGRSSIKNWRAGILANGANTFLMVSITEPYFDRLQHALFFRRTLWGVLASAIGSDGAVRHRSVMDCSVNSSGNSGIRGAPVQNRRLVGRTRRSCGVGLCLVTQLRSRTSNF